MSSKIVAFILFLVLLINVGSIFSIEYERRKEKDKRIDDKVEVNEEKSEEPKNEAKEEPENNSVADEEKEKISTGGAFVDAEKANSAPNYKALEKSKINQTRMKQDGRWIATNYVYGDITTNTWKVQRGDTLWEISEARYGSGRNWTRIKDLNKSKINESRNGNKTLILPGVVLKLK